MARTERRYSAGESLGSWRIGKGIVSTDSFLFVLDTRWISTRKPWATARSRRCCRSPASSLSSSPMTCVTSASCDERTSGRSRLALVSFFLPLLC